MNRWLLILFIASLVLGSASCVSHQQSGAFVGAGAGAAAGHALTDGSPLGTLLGAIIGASIGADIGRQMDEADRRRAFYALEYQPTGQPYNWVNPDTGYEYSCTPTHTYEGPEGPCREFILLTEIDGAPAEIQGTACRAPDGTWQTVGE